MRKFGRGGSSRHGSGTRKIRGRGRSVSCSRELPIAGRANPASEQAPRRTQTGVRAMKILIADDDPVSSRLLDRLLVKWGYEVIAAHDGAEAWEVLKAENAPRVALLDWIMPGLDGVEICRRARARSSQPYVYIMLLTANDKVGNLVEGLESGADDYLTKPFHPQELRARLRVGLRMLDLEGRLVEARESLRFKASHDSLTTIWNRGAIIEMLERELSRARRDGSSGGILLADFDHFKRVNDTRGHLVGDEVLSG